MRFRVIAFALASLLFLPGLVACQSSDGPASNTSATSLNVVAVETFLADIAQNVAGDRVKVAALMPLGVDPHSYEPTPTDVKTVARSDVLIVNGAGFETFLDKLLQNAGGERQVLQAAAGLKSRTAREGEATEMSDPDLANGDPHFWLDPSNAVKYVENIRDGLTEADPGGAATYTANATAYIAKLKDLDKWVAEQVSQIPPEHRQLVTNHESFGYFADRYGFTVVGTIVPSVSTESSPSAQQLARLVDRVKKAGARALFLETGTNPQLAQEVSQETGIKVVTGLYTHSISEANEPAPTYLDIIRFNTTAIVDALK